MAPPSITTARTPYPDRGFEGREQWAEMEAQQLEKFMDSLQEILLQRLDQLTTRAKSGRPHLDYCHLGFGEAHEVAVQIHTYAKMADQLRQPRNIRLERADHEG